MIFATAYNTGKMGKNFNLLAGIAASQMLLRRTGVEQTLSVFKFIDLLVIVIWMPSLLTITLSYNLVP